MTGLRIDIDVKGLVHEQWAKLPLWKRIMVALIPGVSRRAIEAEAVRRMTAPRESKP